MKSIHLASHGRYLTSPDLADAIREDLLEGLRGGDRQISIDITGVEMTTRFANRLFAYLRAGAKRERVGMDLKVIGADPVTADKVRAALAPATDPAPTELQLNENDLSHSGLANIIAG